MRVWGRGWGGGGTSGAKCGKGGAWQGARPHRERRELGFVVDLLGADEAAFRHRDRRGRRGRRGGRRGHHRAGRAVSSIFRDDSRVGLHRGDHERAGAVAQLEELPDVERLGARRVHLGRSPAHREHRPRVEPSLLGEARVDGHDSAARYLACRREHSTLQVDGEGGAERRAGARHPAQAERAHLWKVSCVRAAALAG